MSWSKLKWLSNFTIIFLCKITDFFDQIGIRMVCLILRFDFKTHFLIGSCFSSGAWSVNHFQNSSFLFRINPEITWTSSSIFCNKIFILGVAYDLWIKKKKKYVMSVSHIQSRVKVFWHTITLVCFAFTC